MVDNSAAACKAFVADFTRVGAHSWFNMFRPCVRFKFVLCLECLWTLSTHEQHRILRIFWTAVYLQQQYIRKESYNTYKKQLKRMFQVCRTNLCVKFEVLNEDEDDVYLLGYEAM
jgi:hypothetical protein